ncbi:unnamed protein product [Paramecium primaurelia]|uniref:Uncharacterized protein n=1 Tax=Paramecium primaurelia TaxID=5886 RepID=A0A8S1PPV6_PARPR|nr:unnamed protein product [Paramecium primaurelia]
MIAIFIPQDQSKCDVLWKLKLNIKLYLQHIQFMYFKVVVQKNLLDIPLTELKTVIGLARNPTFTLLFVQQNKQFKQFIFS